MVDGDELQPYRASVAVSAPCKAQRQHGIKAMMGGGGGMFTQTRPDVRRIVPESRPGVPVVKVVYVVLEAQCQSSLSAAVMNINRTRKEIRVEVVGYLVEELCDKDNFETFKKDVADANIFIGSLIFVEELAQKVKEVVEANRDTIGAVEERHCAIHEKEEEGKCGEL